MTELKKININTALKPGDRLQIDIVPRFSINATLSAYLTAGRIYDIQNNHPEFTLNRWDTLDGGGVRLFLTVNDSVKMYQAGVLTPAAIIAIAVGVAAIFLSISVYKVSDVIEETIQTPAGQVAAAGSGIILAALGVGAIWFVFFRKAKT